MASSGRKRVSPGPYSRGGHPDAASDGGPHRIHIFGAQRPGLQLMRRALQQCHGTRRAPVLRKQHVMSCALLFGGDGAQIEVEPLRKHISRGYAAAASCAGPRRVLATCCDTCHRAAPPMCRNGRKWQENGKQGTHGGSCLVVLGPVYLHGRLAVR